MGLCCSCRKSKARFRDKSTKICGHIQSAVSPLHVSHEDAPYQVNGHLPTVQIQTDNSPHLSVRQSMANSFPNIKFTNPIKVLVSKSRIRYKKDGFDLDLTYITDNIIAMGFPASKIEGVYRNHIDDVVKFLDLKHKDHYFIYNLCSERCYDTSKFHNRVRTFAFDDHNPPKIELMQDFCRDVHTWLIADPKNVAVVHCKAGKGRTGTMICCYLLYSGRYATADKALRYYGQERTQDRKGVTIPSQVRYVNYYARIIREGLSYVPISVEIKKIVLEPVPLFAGGQGTVYFCISQQNCEEGKGPRLKSCKKAVQEIKKGATSIVIHNAHAVAVRGDIKIELFQKSKIRKEKLFQFWFNPFFVDEKVPESAVNGFLDGHSDDGVCSGVLYAPVFSKKELDIVNKKDKQNKVFSADFRVTVFFHKLPPSESSASTWPREVPNEAHENPSESSEADETSEDETNEEDEWDSVVEGENVDPRGVGYRLLSECELSSHLTSTSGKQQPELLAA